MTDAELLAIEPTVRGGAFVALLGILALAERTRPCRGDARPAGRQLVNLALVGVDTLTTRLLLPVVGIVLAARLRAEGVGIFALVHWPEPLEVVISVLALDLTIYFQHRLLHRVPVLWRAHRVHHSDLAFDVTLGVRFHPLEVVLSHGVKVGAIACLGAAPLAVLIFEVVLQTGALFTHVDVALPEPVERWVRRLIVTPSLHRVHHSIERDETDSNFGFSVVWWDRLFGTFRAAPRRPEATMPVGVPEFRDAGAQRFAALLLQPFAPAAPRSHTEVSHAR